MFIAIARWFLRLFGKLDLVVAELGGDAARAWLTLSTPIASLRPSHPLLHFLKAVELERLTGAQVWEFKRRWAGRRAVRWEARDTTDWREVKPPPMALDVSVSGTTAAVEFRDTGIACAYGGWFRRGPEWWPLKVDEEPFLARKSIYASERIRTLFAERVPAWRAAGIEIRGAMLAVENRSLLKIDLDATDRGDLTVRAAYTETFTPLKSDERWALAGRAIVPVPAPTPTVKRALEKPVTLDPDAAAAFLRDEMKDPRVLDASSAIITVRGEGEDFLLEMGLVWGEETFAFEGELREAGRLYLRKKGSWCRIDLPAIDKARVDLLSRLRREFLDPGIEGVRFRLREDDVAEFRAFAGDWFKGWRIIYQKSAADAHLVARGPTRPILRCVRAASGGLGYVGLQVELDLAGVRAPLHQVAPVLDLGTRWFRREKTWLEVDRRIVQRLVEGVPPAWRKHLERPLPIDAHRLDEMLEEWKPYGEVTVDPEIARLRDLLTRPSLPPRWPKSFATSSPGAMRLFSWIGACSDFAVSPTLHAPVDRDLFAAIAALAVTYREAGGAGPILVVARSKRLPAWADGLPVLAPLRILNLVGRRKAPAMEEVAGTHVLLVAPNTLETAAFGAIDGEWPAIVFDQIDQTVSTDGSKAFEALSRLSARMRIACVSEKTAFDKVGKMAALVGILYPDAGSRLLYEADSKEERARQLDLLQAFVSPFSYDPAANAKLFAARPVAKADYTTIKFATAVRRRDGTARVDLGERAAADAFVKEAFARRNETAPLCGRVPFKCDRPTYASLTPAQRHWYFYWRAQFRAGKPLETDVAIVNLHAYEILNLAEERDPRLAIHRLSLLWRTFRQQHPKIDAAFIDWIGDLYFVHVGTEAGLAWEWKHHDFGRPFHELDLLVQKYAENPGEMPLPLWRRLSGYRPSPKLPAEEVDLVHHQAIQAAVAWWRRRGGSVFDAFIPPRSVRIRRALYENAVVASTAPREIVIGRARLFSRSPDFAAHLMAVLKHGENALRKKLGLPRHRGVEIDPALAREIEGVRPVEEIRLALDAKLVEQLQKESDAVREILAAPDDAPAAEPVEEKETVQPVRASDGRMLYTSMAEVRRLWRELGFMERQTVSDIHRGAVRNLKTLEVQLRSAGQLPLPLLDRINEAASDVLGDLLIAVEGEAVSITGDFRDELEVVIDGKVASAEKDGYAALVAQLDAAEKALLSSLLQGPLPNAKVDEILRPHNVMSSLAVDRLNEKATVTVGDLVLVSDGATVSIEEDDLAPLKERLG